MMAMTPTETRLIPRVLTAVATMMLVAGVISMHSFMTGHTPMAHAGPITAAVPPHTMGTTVRTPLTSPSQVQRVDAFNAPTTPSAQGIVAVCLAVLPALALLVILWLPRLNVRQRTAPSGAGGTLQQRVGIRGSPPRRTTPSLSQLCVLRA